MKNTVFSTVNFIQLKALNRREFISSLEAGDTGHNGIVYNTEVQ